VSDNGRSGAVGQERDEGSTPVHIFTVDVEEYFQVHAFDGYIHPGEWDALPARVHKATPRLLDLLAERGFRATFFVLGWVAERNPEVVRRIATAGHEIASHGWSHRRITDLTPEEFRREVRDSKRLLEEITGRAVRGYRAPSYSLVPGTEWVLEILLQEGYLYDSSMFPIRRNGYGYPTASPDPHLLSTGSGTLLELPLATLEWAGLRLPAAGGAYFRHLPYELARTAFARLGERDVPGTFYIHSWEVDPHQPRIPVSWLARWRHYGGLDRTVERLRRLLGDFDFTSVERRFHLESVTRREPDHELPSHSDGHRATDVRAG